MHVYLYLHANSLGNRWCRKKKFFFISFAVAYVYLHELSFLDMSAYLSLLKKRIFQKMKNRTESDKNVFENEKKLK